MEKDCGSFLEQRIYLHWVDFANYQSMRRRILGRRRRNLHCIEQTTGASLTLHGPSPCYLAASHPDQRVVAQAILLAQKLLDNTFLGSNDASRQTAPVEASGADKEYLTASEMENVLTRLGVPGAAELVAEMRVEGLPFSSPLGEAATAMTGPL